MSGPLLGILEQVEDLNGHVLSKKTGKILGYRTKKSTGALNMGRRFQGPARRTLDFATSSGEGENQEGKNKEVTDHLNLKRKKRMITLERNILQLMRSTTGWKSV